MVNYKKVFLNYFDLTPADWVGCIGCGTTAKDLHHLTFKSQGGKDVIENLAPVCRECHIKCHDNKDFNESIRAKHIKTL